MSTLNVKLPEDHTQVCIWTGTVVKPDEIADFESFFMDEMRVRVKYLETIETKADKSGPGGRHDVFFSVHRDDVMKFATPRLSLGIRWFEDAISSINGGNTLYPKRVEAYDSWRDEK